MTMIQERPIAMPAAFVDRPIPVTRRRIDKLLIGIGAVLAAGLVVAGGLLTWGSSFSGGYVRDELAAQKITFPDEAALREEGRDDLVRLAGQSVSTGEHAEAYASFVGGHIATIGGGRTYAELGGPEREAKAAVTEAIASGAPADEVASLQAAAAKLSGQRDTIFKGEMIRGTLLNAFAWSTMGRIAGIAATVAFVGAGVLAMLVLAGLVHLRKVKAA